MATIRVTGVTELVNKLNEFGRRGALKNALKAGAVYLKGKIAQYPPKNRPTRKSVYGQTFKSDKQRRFFFGALKHGAIQVPYRRGQSPGSEKLGQSWTVEANDLYATVGTAVSYAPLVQKRDAQSLYHRAVGWQTAEDVAERETDAVVSGVARALEADLAALGL
jgi:hypothetical protein